MISFPLTVQGSEVRIANMSGVAKDWLIWQLADSAFPAGGFAHSGGIEAAFQQGEIRNRDELMLFLQAALVQTGNAVLPFVSASFEGKPSFREIDQLCDAFTSNHVANRASRAQGQSLLATAAKSFSGERLQQLRNEVLDHELPCHLAPVFGAVTAALGLDREQTLRLFLFWQLRGWIASSVRLGITGPLQGQSLQHELANFSEDTLQRSINLDLDDVAQSAPLLDLFQGNQDRLYSRLFQS